jgi:hypothetical protein
MAGIYSNDPRFIGLLCLDRATTDFLVNPSALAGAPVYS